MDDDHPPFTGDHHEDPEAHPPGDDRDRTAEARDEIAEAHDRAAETRDERADARDRRAGAREEAGDTPAPGAVADRAAGLRDRRAAGSDRQQAADDREAASAERAISASERKASSIDELTGTHSRQAGMVELQREMARAKRTGQPLVLAFIDVDDLKTTNDSLGHTAGDQLLCQVANSLCSHLRPYDLILRFGGDEFVCALPGISVPQAAERFSLVNADLAAVQQASVSVGLAALEADDSVEDLITRADQALYRERRRDRPLD